MSVLSLPPVLNGSQIDWTPSTGDNWEVQSDGSEVTYCSAGAVGDIDLFTHDPILSAYFPVRITTVSIRMQITSGDANSSVAAYWSLDGNAAQGTSYVSSGPEEIVDELLIPNPRGREWHLEDIAELEYGYICTGLGAYMRVHDIELKVEFSHDRFSGIPANLSGMGGQSTLNWNRME